MLGDHCTGDGIKMTMGAGGATVDMTSVQVHPTGLVHPSEPDAKVKFLAAEALRGVGGLLLTNKGQRFVDELGTRDYVTGEMWKAKAGPYRLVLNGKGSNEILWHCKHYVGRGLSEHTHNSTTLAVAPRCFAFAHRSFVLPLLAVLFLFFPPQHEALQERRRPCQGDGHLGCGPEEDLRQVQRWSKRKKGRVWKEVLPQRQSHTSQHVHLSPSRAL